MSNRHCEKHTLWRIAKEANKATIKNAGKRHKKCAKCRFWLLKKKRRKLVSTSWDKGKIWAPHCRSKKLLCYKLNFKPTLLLLQKQQIIVLKANSDRNATRTATLQPRYYACDKN